MHSRGCSTRDVDAGILCFSREADSAPSGSTKIALSQSTASVERDREPSRSAHVPKRCAAGMGDVRIVDRQFGGASDGGTTAAVGDGRSEACARHEVQSIRATSGAHTREIHVAFAFGPVLVRGG